MQQIGQRLKRVREALGLTQERFSEALECSQSLVAQWERGTRPVADLSNLSPLVAHLAEPSVIPFAGRVAEQYSPLAFLTRDRPVSLLSEVSTEEWLDRFSRAVWPTSKDPYRRSAILAGQRMGPFLEDMPAPEAVSQDLNFHGEDFLRALARHETDAEAVAFEGLEEVVALGKASALEAFQQLGELARGDGGLMKGFSAELEMAVEDGDLLSVLPRWWAEYPEAYAFGMDLLALALPAILDGGGEPSRERLELLFHSCEQWEFQRDNIMGLSDPDFHRLLEPIREGLMNLAILDAKRRTKPKRGRPRKAKP